MDDKIEIREIKESDNAALASIVRSCLLEFNAAKPGTVFYDDSTDHLYELFREKRSKYFVVEINSAIAGGAGIYPTPGVGDDTCELVKMYLLPFARGKGLGKLLLQKCFNEARQQGYKKMYLESMPELQMAISLYQKSGFTFLKGSQGCSGHTGCDVWMIKEL